MKKINLLILVFLFVMFQSNAQTVTVSMIGGNPDNCTGNSITGAYTLSSVINGKNSYVKGIHTIKWTGTKWAMDESGFEIYYNNTSTPLDPPCGTWNGTFGCFQIDLTGNCTAACINPTTPSVTSNPTTVCLGNTATLSISGTLNDATQWSIYTGSCGGTLLGTTTSSSLVVTPSGTSTTYYVRGEGGCITPGSCGSVTVNVSNISLTQSSQTNIACNGGSNGAASVNAATGGAGGYTYNWTPGNPTGDGTTSITGLTAATWTCTVTDIAGCTKATNFTVTQPTALSLTPVSQTNIACNGGSTGAASVNAATGGAGGYTYNWTPGNPTGDGTTSVTGLTAGTWTCTVTDANACTASYNFNVAQPTALSLTPVSQTNIACNGGSTGAASVTASGGAGGYTYNWTPGNPTGDGTTSVTGLTAGTWTCTVTDANSCTTSYNFNVAQPTALSLTPSSQTNIACNGGSTGAASVNTATGGAGGYTYNWTPGNPTGDGTTSVTGLTAGTWTCTVTDANSCTVSYNFNVAQPTALSLTPVSQTNIACNGGSTGAAAVNTATGGSGGYTYNWTPGNPTGDGTTSVTGLTAGTWTCTVTDANSCTAATNYTITQPATALTGSQTLVECAGFSVTVGSNTYTTTGIYTDVLTGSNGCDSTVTTDLTIINISDQTVTAVQNAFCNNGSTTIDLGSSEIGFDYYLRNDSDNSIVDGPIAGTGSGLSLNTGSINATTTYNVYAANYSPVTANSLEFTGNTGLKKVSLGTNLWTDNFVGTNQLTVEAWVNRSATGSLHSIIGNYQGSYPFLFRIDNDKIVLYMNSVSSVTSSSTIPVGVWTHLAGTYDGTNLKVYINGVLEGTTAYTGNFIATTNEIKIGGGLSNNTEYFPGDIADVRLWTVAKTQSEIAAGKDFVLNGNETNLIANYQFTEGSGTTTANSATGNAYPGTLVNNPAWVVGPTLMGVTCDLEMTTLATVTINTPTASTDTQVACDSYTWSLNSTTYTASTNTPTVTLTNAAGCDSIVTLDLTINSLPVITAQSSNLTSCGDNSALFYVNSAGNNTYQWYFDGISFSDFAMIDGSYTEINFDTDSMTIQSLVDGGYNNYFVYCTVTDAVTGCSINSANDSITVLEPTTGSQTFVECAGFSVTVGTNTYNATGVFTDVLVGSNGCDSTVTTDLTIKQPTTGSQTFVECVGFSVTVGTNTYNTTGVYTDVLVSSNGCDSTVTTDLTIKQPTTGSQTLVECAGFSVTVGTNTYNTTGVYTDVLVGSNGCDSTVTTDLTVEQAIDVTIDNSLAPTLSANQTGATYQWLDCDNGNAIIPSETAQSFTATANGNYAVEVTVGSCVDTSACENISTVGVKEIANHVVSIYPNPTSGLFTINLNNLQGEVNYTITTLEGRIVKQANNITTNNVEVDLSNESKGVYLLRINEGNTNKVYKIVRQ